MENKDFGLGLSLLLNSKNQNMMFTVLVGVQKYLKLKLDFRSNQFIINEEYTSR